MALEINDLLAKMAADFGVPDLSSGGSPIISTQGVLYLNIARWDLIRFLCPTRSKGGEMTVGRQDKLTRLTSTDDETQVGVAGNDPLGMDLPTAGGTPIYFFNIAFQTDNAGEFYPAKEESFEYIYVHRTGTPYAATAAAPLFAWGDGAIFKIPAGTEAQNQHVRYQFVKLPADIAVDGDWDLDEDLALIALERALAWAWGRKSGEEAEVRIAGHLAAYQEKIGFLLGSFSKIIEEM